MGTSLSIGAFILKRLGNLLRAGHSFWPGEIPDVFKLGEVGSFRRDNGRSSYQHFPPKTAPHSLSLAPDTEPSIQAEGSSFRHEAPSLLDGSWPWAPSPPPPGLPVTLEARLTFCRACAQRSVVPAGSAPGGQHRARGKAGVRFHSRCSVRAPSSRGPRRTGSKEEASSSLSGAPPGCAGLSWGPWRTAGGTDRSFYPASSQEPASGTPEPARVITRQTLGGYGCV